LWGVALVVIGLAVVVPARGQDLFPVQPQALQWAGVQELRQSAPDLTGSGVRLGVVCRSFTYSAEGEPQNDYLPNMRHVCFRDAELSFHSSLAKPAGTSGHATAICSILFGQDPDGTASILGSFPYQGVVPQAQGHIYEFWHFVKHHVYRQDRPEVDIASVSFGQPVEAEWTRGIEALIEHKSMVFVASIGNGLNASDPSFYPGAGPNVIGVGVVSSVNATDPITKLSQFALAYPEESSAGPTADGRCKPDVIAPGNCLVAEEGADRGYGMTGNWSSFATPVAAGIVGLLMQTAKQNPQFSPVLSPEGGNCLLKAILMNSAVKLPYWHKGELTPDDDHEVPLDYVQGAGMVNAARAHQLLTSGQGKPGDIGASGWDLNWVRPGLEHQQVYRIVVEEPSQKTLTATLVWNRHYGQVYPFKRLSDIDSDLRLEVFAIDAMNATQPVKLLDYSDSRVDNVEHIYVDLGTLPGCTVYELVVSYSDLNVKSASSAGERYALAWSIETKQADESLLWYDLNADGVVDDHDLAILKNNSLAGQKSSPRYLLGDITRDGVIDDADVLAVEANRNKKAVWRIDTVAVGSPPVTSVLN
ncbi:MAG TPA: S8 family serine peptidase, partial [Sedimentisphaerales bacterium]|nr:S8 family serine peptidase [Sedimentisphaerales bacterium]